MFIIEYAVLIGAALMLLTFMGISIGFAKFSWGCFKEYKDYMFVVFSLGLFGTFLMSFALFALIMLQLFTGAI